MAISRRLLRFGRIPLRLRRFGLAQDLVHNGLVVAVCRSRVVGLVGPEEPRGHGLAPGQLHRAGLQEGKRVLMLKAGAGEVVGGQSGQWGPGTVCATHQLKGVGAPTHAFAEAADDRPGCSWAGHVLAHGESCAR
ncbi:MAG TPA: hypothetical protein VIM34_10935 [Burkholderiaceae bacterium]